MRAHLLSVGKSRPGTRITPTGIVIHSTADPGATARDVRAWFSRPDSPPSSYHVVCDWKESLVLIPCFPGACEKAYHAGPKANSRYIGVCACEATRKDDDVKTYERLVKIVRGLCWIWEFPIDEGHIVSHFWVSKNLGGTDHEDPIQWLGKLGKTWDQFVKDLQEGRI